MPEKSIGFAPGTGKEAANKKTGTRSPGFLSDTLPAGIIDKY